MKKIALVLGATATLALGASYEYETTVLGGYGFSTNTRAADGGVLGHQGNITLRLGKNMESFPSRFEAGVDFAPSVKFKAKGAGIPTDKKANIFRVYGHMLHDIGVTDNFSVYWLAGVGYQTLSEKAYNLKSSPFVHAGLGLAYKVSDSVKLLAEVRDIMAKNSNNTLITSLGFSYGFGEKATPAADPMPAPAPAPAASVEKVIRLNVNFAFDSDKIPAEFASKIDAVAAAMNEDPAYRVLLEGHTDSTGPEAYNQKLSERRANAVAKYLIEKGVPSDKISTTGFGETQPIADNATKEGRAQNRRVDAKFSK